jgi:protein SCO1/2
MKPMLIALLMLIAAGLRAADPLPARPGFAQHLGAQLPLTATVIDETGRRRTLGSLFNGNKPVVLSFNYFRCTQLCSIVADGTEAALRQLAASVGRDYLYVSLSIDPTDTPAGAAGWQERLVKRYGRNGAAAGWHTLTSDQAGIAAITKAAGFGFRYDRPSRQFAHPSGFLVVTPRGVISQYFLGVDFKPAEVAAALRRAGSEGLGAKVYNLVLSCFGGHGPVGKYGRVIRVALAVAVSLTLIVVFGGIGWMLRREFQARPRPEAGP